MSDQKIDVFVQLYREVVSELDARSVGNHELTLVDDEIAYAQLAAPAWNTLLENCRRCFTTDKLAALGRFIDCHRDADDVLAVVLRAAWPLSSGRDLVASGEPHCVAAR